MPRKPKGEIMTQAEMIEAGKQKRATSRIYKAESQELSNDAIRRTVARGYAELENVAYGQKIDLSDIDMVKACSLQYIRSCADSVCFPSMSGLARAFGCDRSTLYKWMKYKHDTETGRWIALCHDLYSDVLAEASLRNDCHPIVSIFLLKALYGMRDNVTIEVTNEQYDDDFDKLTADDYKKKYMSLIKGEFE